MKALLELTGSGPARTGALRLRRGWGWSAPAEVTAPPPAARVGVIRNPLARRNRGARPHPPAPGVSVAEPRSQQALAEALTAFADGGLDLLVVDGGDGTVRDVLGLAPEMFGAKLPRIAVLASGTTNALAADLGAGPGWSLAAAMASRRTTVRAPVEVLRLDSPGSVHRGFVFGAGAYVEAMRLAHRVRQARTFGGLTVGATLAGAFAHTALAGREGAWRTGVSMRLQHRGEATRHEARFLLLVSTLERLPLGMKPFGPPRPGLKVLDVAGAPRRLRWALPTLLAGREKAWLAAAGYRRTDADRLHVGLHTPYVLDGEEFEGGELLISRGAPITFVVP